MGDAPHATGVRRVLLVTHTGRAEARDLADQCARALIAGGIHVRVLAEEAESLAVTREGSPLVEVHESIRADDDCEIALVIGGDGTILRAAELTHRSSTPLLGINLGHVGFLAEAEPDAAQAAVRAVIDRSYVIEERLALNVDVYDSESHLLYQSFALNEASIEKASRERMIEVVIEVDHRPVSRWGGDGVVCATPTGSTAYNFSAGGPIVWPDVEAMLMVPLSAHALFARPLVVSPGSVMAIEVLSREGVTAVLWCDGRRPFDLPVGARIEVTRNDSPVRLARLHQEPFTDRLVTKFALPVEGWRGGTAAG